MSRAVGGDLIEEVGQHQIAAPGHQPSDMIAAMAPTLGAADFELQVIGEVGEDLGAVAGHTRIKERSTVVPRAARLNIAQFLSGHNDRRSMPDLPLSEQHNMAFDFREFVQGRSYCLAARSHYERKADSNKLREQSGHFLR